MWLEEAKKIRIETLAGLVVNVAEGDRTTPDSSNLEVGWFTDQLLRQIEGWLVGGGHLGDYVSICMLALGALRKLPNVAPEVIILVQLAFLKGTRRQRLSREQQEALLITAKELEQAVSALPDGPRKKRCELLLQ